MEPNCNCNPHLQSFCETCSVDSEAYRGMERDKIIWTTRWEGLPLQISSCNEWALCQCWSTCQDQRNRAEEQTQGHTNPDITQRKQLQSSSGGIQSSVRTVARLDNHMGKTFPRLLPYHTQINSRFIKNLHVEKRNSKALLSNIGEHIHDLRVEKSFLNKP